MTKFLCRALCFNIVSLPLWQWPFCRIVFRLHSERLVDKLLVSRTAMALVCAASLLAVKNNHFVVSSVLHLQFCCPSVCLTCCAYFVMRKSRDQWCQVSMVPFSERRSIIDNDNFRLSSPTLLQIGDIWRQQIRTQLKHTFYYRSQFCGAMDYLCAWTYNMALRIFLLKIAFSRILILTISSWCVHHL